MPHAKAQRRKAREDGRMMSGRISGKAARIPIILPKIILPDPLTLRLGDFA
jgi:hypothetical protein